MGSNHNVNYFISLAKIMEIGKSLSIEKIKAVKEEEIPQFIKLALASTKQTADLPLREKKI